MIYTIKRFSADEEPKKESHALRNTLIGVGALAGGVMAGRAGWLGAGVQKGIGKATAKVGKWTGSGALARDGVKTYQKGSVKSGLNELASGSKTTVDKLSSGDISIAHQNAALDSKEMINKMGIGDLMKKTPKSAPPTA